MEHTTPLLRQRARARSTSTWRMAHGGQREEMAAIAPRDVGLVRQLEVGLVDQSGGRQRGTDLAQVELAARDEPETLVDDRHESIERFSRAIAQFRQRVGAQRGGFHRLRSMGRTGRVAPRGPTGVCISPTNARTWQNGSVMAIRRPVSV